MQKVIVNHWCAELYPATVAMMTRFVLPTEVVGKARQSILIKYGHWVSSSDKQPLLDWIVVQWLGSVFPIASTWITNPNLYNGEGSKSIQHQNGSLLPLWQSPQGWTPSTKSLALTLNLFEVEMWSIVLVWCLYWQLRCCGVEDCVWDLLLQLCCVGKTHLNL